MQHFRYLTLAATALFALAITTTTVTAQTEDKKSDRPRNLTEEQRTQFFKRLDRNQDGKLSKTEVPERAWERLSRADRNQDGAVSAEELTAAAKAIEAMSMGRRNGNRGGAGPAGIMKAFDENTDGELAESEVSAGMWTKISQLDTDKSGSVSRAELAKAYQPAEK